MFTVHTWTVAENTANVLHPAAVDYCFKSDVMQRICHRITEFQVRPFAQASKNQSGRL